MREQILGYRRSDGSFGIRNYAIVLPTVICANEVVRKIACQVDKAIPLPHTTGCTFGEDLEKAFRTMVGLVTHPNVGGALLVSLGCENIDSQKLIEEIRGRCPERPVQSVTIQEEGGTTEAIKVATSKLQKIVSEVSKSTLKEGDLGEITVAIQCGGSDATSGLAANPAIGIATEKVVAAGGSAIFTETTELIGGEQVLPEKVANKEVYQDLLAAIKRVKVRGQDEISKGERLISTGNIQGGITTLEEKSLGTIAKAGDASIREVIGYAERPNKKGVIFMDGPGLDIPSMTGMVAGGAQIVLFSTGKGSPVGYPMVPVIKVTGNPKTSGRLKDNIDINAGSIIEGQETIEEVGKRILAEIIKVCKGKKTKAELLGFKDFSISTSAGSF